jgi:hypothetical protein
MIIFLIGVNLINPDAYIAKQNLTRFDQTGKIDALYLMNLSPDAVPEMIAVYGKLSTEDKIVAKDILLAHQTRWENFQTSWQSYNYSTSKAIEKLKPFILEK